MKSDKFLFLVFTVLLVLASPSGANSGKAAYLPFDPFFIAVNVFALIAVLAIISIFFQNWMTENIKKIFFLAISASVVLTTIYAAGSTVYLNIISESGGPVHWHADFEIWVCGEKIANLKEPQGLSNKVGSAVFHHHNDFRIHVEGIVINKEDISLGDFFEVIGGGFDGKSLSVILSDGSIKTVSNGDTCAGSGAGKWQLYIKNYETGEFSENFELDKYIIKPEFNVPPGDFLKLVFDSGKEGLDGS